MNAALLLIIALIVYTLAYVFYGKFLSKTFGLDKNRSTPAHTKRDGIDFVPAKNWLVLFGHHFASICGAGPIVGPALACAYWGWGVSVVWIMIGAVWMGAVSDFSSLVTSVRAEGGSIAQVSGTEISPKVRKYFLIFLFISLLLVIAVFAIFAAKTFITQPDTVVPSFGLIPTALIMGWFLYQKKGPYGPATIAGLAIVVGLLWLGRKCQIILPDIGWLDAQSSWILILLIYCFIASVVPVNVLLQPRDYLASFILFAMIGFGIISILIVRPVITAPAFTAFQPADWPKAGPLIPMLFVTIACGAISGFHALVSSGTTSKQISSETHCFRIGYGGMLTESLVGILVVIFVSAGIAWSDLGGILKAGGPIAAFGTGFGEISSVLLGSYGKAFAILALNAFILTTLDSATRITRYITAELFGINNKYVATLIAVVGAAALALTGKWNLLWPAFGAANQLIAGITLLVATCWLLNRQRNYFITLIPAVLMLVITLTAFVLQFKGALMQRSVVDGRWSPNWILMGLTAVLIGIALSIIKETFIMFRKSKPGLTATTWVF